jgi:EpsI family protein
VHRGNRSLMVVVVIVAALGLMPLDPPASFSIDGVKSARLESVPLELGDWTGKELPLDERTYEILETKNVVSRTYEKTTGESLHLLLVGSNKDRRVAHPPEVCYISSHYEISRTANTKLEVEQQVIPAKTFTAMDQRQLGRSEEVLYFYQVGERFTDNYYAQQLQFAWDRLARRESEILLVRVASATQDMFDDFLGEILPHIAPSEAGAT